MSNMISRIGRHRLVPPKLFLMSFENNIIVHTARENFIVKITVLKYVSKYGLKPRLRELIRYEIGNREIILFNKKCPNPYGI